MPRFEGVGDPYGNYESDNPNDESNMNKYHPTINAGEGNNSTYSYETSDRTASVGNSGEGQQYGGYENMSDEMEAQYAEAFEKNTPATEAVQMVVEDAINQFREGSYAEVVDIIEKSKNVPMGKDDVFPLYDNLKRAYEGLKSRAVDVKRYGGDYKEDLVRMTQEFMMRITEAKRRLQKEGMIETPPPLPDPADEDYKKAA